MNSTLGSVVPLAMFLKTVLKSDLWPGSEKCGVNPNFKDNDLRSGCYRVPKLPPLSVNYVCPISHETNHPIMIPKIVLKSVLWRSLESAWYFCIFPLLCFSLHPNVYGVWAGARVHILCKRHCFLIQVLGRWFQRFRMLESWFCPFCVWFLPFSPPQTKGHFCPKKSLCQVPSVLRFRFWHS